jgi:Fe-S cluster biogenesis protein NfuA
VFIQTEETPNPESLKFLPGRVVLATGTLSFTTEADCVSSPFARRLLQIDGVGGVFFGSDFITITKVSEKEWYVLKPIILGIIMEQFISNLPVVLDVVNHDNPNQESLSSLDDSDPLVRQIKELIDTRVRPAVAQDGGDILFHSFEDGVVYLKMQGACSGCPSSSATLKSGIENMLRYYVPEVLEVRAVE